MCARAHREYDVQASSEATLKDTNIALQSRHPYSPQENGAPEDGEPDSPFEAIPLIWVAAIVGVAGVITAALLIFRAKKSASSRSTTR